MASRDDPTTTMTRAEVLARYRPIRSGIRRVLGEAVAACGRPDLTRAAKQVAPWGESAKLKGALAGDMVADIALFEPNQRGRRAYDRFLAEKAVRLGAEDRELAGRMGAAWFSMFRVAGRHAAAGVWLEDMLAEDRRLWLVDEGLEASAAEGMVIGLRVFDAGPFHAGYGIVVQPDEETVRFCVAAAARGSRGPFRYSLAATLYGDLLRAKMLLGHGDLAVVRMLLETLARKKGGRTGAAVPDQRRSAGRRRRRES